MRTRRPLLAGLSSHFGRRTRFGARRRAVGVLVFVAFLSGWSIDVGGLHDCPHHDLAAPAGAEERSGHPDPSHGSAGTHGSAGAHDSAGAHVSSGAHAHDAAGEHEAEQEHDHEGPCSCRTDCTGATAVRPAPLHGVERTEPSEALPGPRAGEASLHPTRTLLPHVLPWPTAPPPRG